MRCDLLRSTNTELTLNYSVARVELRARKASLDY